MKNPNPHQPSTINNQPTALRRGKIAQLPKELREKVNLMLHAHTSSRKIIAFLAERGQPHINAVNLSNWFRGDRAGSSGYNDWLREREELSAMQLRREFASQLVTKGDGSQIHEATRLMAAAQLSEVILGFDLTRLKTALAAKPIAFATLVTALRRLSRDSLGYQKYRQLVEEQKAKIQAACQNVKQKDGLTPEAIRQIQDAVLKM